MLFTEHLVIAMLMETCVSESPLKTNMRTKRKKKEGREEGQEEELLLKFLGYP